jgi:hypothetical protein
MLIGVVWMHVFIYLSDYTCISICVYTVLKKPRCLRATIAETNTRGPGPTGVSELTRPHLAHRSVQDRAPNGRVRDTHAWNRSKPDGRYVHVYSVACPAASGEQRNNASSPPCSPVTRAPSEVHGVVVAELARSMRGALAERDRARAGQTTVRGDPAAGGFEGARRN